MNPLEVSAMTMTTELQETLQHKHDELAERLAHARTVIDRPEQSRRGCPPIDKFLAQTSRHLHAVDEVLLPAVGAHCADGAAQVHRYQPAARHLEVLLYHVKAHEYGSTLETTYGWPDLWADVGDALGAWEVREDDLAARLAEETDDDLLHRLALRMPAAEAHAPSRPHPFLPHTGPMGALVRRTARFVDAAWDLVEGRDVAMSAPKPHRKPGLIGQYLLGDPQFEPEPDPGENAPGER